MSSIVEADFSRDRGGKAVEPELSELLELLVRRYETEQVLCFEADEGHCGYWSKRSGIGQSVLDEIRRHGYEPVLFNTRDGDGYMEFRPVERDEL